MSSPFCCWLALSGGYAWYRSYVAQQLGLALNNWILARTAEGYRIDADIAPESGNLADGVANA